MTVVTKPNFKTSCSSISYTVCLLLVKNRKKKFMKEKASSAEMNVSQL